MGVVGKIRDRVWPLKGAMTVGDYLSVRRVKPLTHGHTRVAGIKIVFSDNAGVIHSAREVFSDEVYRFNARTDTPHIIDAGANIGLSILYFKRLNPKATIVAYEPDAAIFQLLRQNTVGLDGVELHQAAAWIEDTELTFYTEGSLAGSVEIDFAGAGKPMTVKAERLRDEIAKRPVDFLKIDIEGAENSVLFDIEDQLDHVDHLFFEYHSTPGKPQQLADLLALVQRRGFRYSINGAHGPRYPFIQTVSQGFDLQLNVLCFRPN